MIERVDYSYNLGSVMLLDCYRHSGNQFFLLKTISLDSHNSFLLKSMRLRVSCISFCSLEVPILRKFNVIIFTAFCKYLSIFLTRLFIKRRCWLWWVYPEYSFLYSRKSGHQVYLKLFLCNTHTIYQLWFK